MIEQTLRKFCEYRRRWLIVIAGTFIVGLVLVMPLVDVYFAAQDEKTELLTELAAARATASQLEQFESRVSEKVAQLKLLETRTVDDESLPALRGQLVDLAKETGCSIRRMSVGATSTRLWVAGDDPTAAKADAKQSDTPSEFNLEWRPVSISLSGSSANLRSLLERQAASGMMMHVKSFELYPSNQNRQSLTLDMEVWYFTLTRKAAT